MAPNAGCHPGRINRETDRTTAATTTASVSRNSAAVAGENASSVTVSAPGCGRRPTTSMSASAGSADTSPRMLSNASPAMNMSFQKR